MAKYKKKKDKRALHKIVSDDHQAPYTNEVASVPKTRKISMVSKKPKRKKDIEQTNLEAHRKRLFEDNISEDKYIKSLSKKLKFDRRKGNKLPRVLIEDGLDYILNICDGENAGNVFDADDMSENGSDFDEDFASVLGKNVLSSSVHHSSTEIEGSRESAFNNGLKNANTRSKKVKFDLTHRTEADHQPASLEDDANKIGSPHQMPLKDDKSEATLVNGGGEQLGNKESRRQRKKRMKASKTDEPKEDIYGRLRDAAGKVIATVGDVEQRYIPPALRIEQSVNDGNDKKSVVLQRLKRQLKGLLNKLSEANMIAVSKEIEELYMKHIRHDMNRSLADLIFDAVIQVPMTPERLVQEHAFLVAVLHANVGSEIGACFLESAARRFDALVKSGGNYGGGKQSDNALLLITHLYTFQIVHSSLIYDVLRMLADRFLEKDVDLILLVLRAAGFSLRKDDPIALKEMMSTLQKKVAGSSEGRDQSRVKFMFEILMAIRNNNMHKIPNYDPSHTEHLCKLLRGMVRKGKSVTELNVSWADLISAESKGRWWVVGSAWKTQDDTGLSMNADASVEDTPVENVSEDIMACARRQRFSTTDRKNIFCILMTAEDYVDAFEKLVRLGLKNQQERSIVYVIIDCCLQERTFNMFYAYVLNRFCCTHRKYKIMVQYAFWDRVKELKSATSTQLSNLAHLLCRLLLFKALSLSTLKVIEFADMNKTVVSFLRQVLLELCLHESEAECLDVFTRVASQAKNHVLCEGLRLFFELFMIKGQDKTRCMSKEVAAKLQARIGAVVKILTDCEAPIKL